MKRFGKKKDTAILELLPQAVATLKKNMLDSIFGESRNDKYSNERPPLRSELFTEEQLKQHAGVISKKHVLLAGQPSEQLLKRLAENEKILLEVHTVLTTAAGKNERIMPAAEWLLDNFYLIEEQIYLGKKHLPRGYSKGLPQLLKGESAGLPRIYDIAVEIISHSDGHIDINNLTGFVTAYQVNTFLKIGELWAFPIMLRLALIENIRRLSIQISVDISNKNLADDWADQLINAAEHEPKNLVLIIADMARSDPPMVSSFIAELARRLREKGSSLSLAMNWIEQQLSDHGLTSEELIQQENQKQAADQVSISNSISSLRFLGNTDWREFVENTCIVEKILRQDINGTYSQMDFFTRDQYRHAVERIAKFSSCTEQQVATMAIEAAANAADTSNDSRLLHVGYYLAGKGLLQLERLAKMKGSAMDTCRKISRRFPLSAYLGGIALLTALVAWPLFRLASNENVVYSILVVIVLAILFTASQLAVNCINWLITISARPRLLPKMDFSKGIPENFRTMVVVPSLLTSVKGIDELIEKLEIRFLSNRDVNLCFALLTDFKDAPHQFAPDDKMLLQAAQHKIIELNKKYERPTNDTFFLFHRARKWNEKEKVWMGHERKRGKLAELNKLILDKEGHDFFSIIGEKNIYTDVKFVITLDADTSLPRETAWKMTGTLAHPLNQAVFSEKKKIITGGYSILQPRVSNSLPGESSSLYAKIHGNEPGTDPYTRAVSDVYQDLFAEGSFIGKGIYDVAMFEKVLSDAFPENRILSHDLLEGCYSRSALITDVQLYEDYPQQYIADMKRRHRWVRGDWQIAGWILPFVKGADNKWHRNHLSMLSRWKIMDNLRRSLVPGSLLLLFIYGWVVSSVPWLWTMSLLLISGFPVLLGVMWELLVRQPDVNFSQHVIFTARTAKDRFLRLFIDIAALPYEACVNAHAIMITLWRILISGKRLLKWDPYNQGQKQKSIGQVYLQMWMAPFFAAAVFVYLSVYFPVVLVFAYPLLAVWALAPAIVWVISRPEGHKGAAITIGQSFYLRKLARKIWSFFETFVTGEDHWLPPDNYQEHPIERVAHRTSPTNIGMALLANLAAHDFGYITTTQLIERTGNTINTLQQLEKYRGHLYNWYDTITLLPLQPKYISTVDSGNFAGHLITLKQGLHELANKKIAGRFFFDGFLDSVYIIIEKINNPTHIKHLKKYVHELNEEYDHVVKDIAGTKKLADKMLAAFEQELSAIQLTAGSEEEWWATKAKAQLTAVSNQLAMLCPWIDMPAPPEKFNVLISALPAWPTLRQLAAIEATVLHKIIAFDAEDNNAAEDDWLNQFREIITVSGTRAKEMLIIAEQLVVKCHTLSIFDYDFLYNRPQHLLTIGYNVDDHRRDNGYYDLLASEARLTTFIAIAQGKLPQESWFALGRQLTSMNNSPLLLSWSGSMFEYLMPLLVMPTYENTLLHQTYKTIVNKQVEYGKKRGVPWGVSESGYNMVDASLNYQYKAFGVPGTGFKRGLGDELVISPYSTIMALMVSPDEAYNNLQLMKQSGFEGRYGFYEAIDYTGSRVQRKQPFTVIRSFMAHHQGMGLLSLAYLLLNKPMQERFAADIQMKSALLLLQERVPRLTGSYTPDLFSAGIPAGTGTDLSMRVINTPHTAIPEVHLLSNGHYHVMVTNSGGGYSRWKNIAVTRWREDATCDNRGNFCYIRDEENDTFWSVAYQPSLQQGDNYEAVFSQGKAEFRRTDLMMETHTEIAVSPEDDIELRRVRITNRSRRRRSIEITSYLEVVIAPPVAEEMHPAFNNLFVETQVIPESHAITCTRRPRSADEPVPWMFHLMKVNDATVKTWSYETDRNSFIGRGNTVHKPNAMDSVNQLAGGIGAVLDPIASIRYSIVIEPHASATVDIITGIAETKEQCNMLIKKYQDQHLTSRVLELAWTHSQVILRQINASESEAQLYTRLAASVVFANDSLRADPAVIIRNQRGQSGLWGYSISGDLPIVLLQIEDANNIELVKQMIQAHTYWRMKGIIADLVIWNEDHGGYRQVLQNQILSLLTPGVAADMKDKPGGIFIRSSDQISNEDRILFQTVARVVIADKWGSLEEQVQRRVKLKPVMPYFRPVKFHASVLTSIPQPGELQFFNGTGGFAADGKEYVISTSASQITPAPWSNILANPDFGSIITESGQSYTWVDNAHECRLTPWNNDPVTDLKGEAFYIKDEESGKFWSPAPLPCRGISRYVTRHGFGYSVFSHSEDGIETTMTVYTDIKAPVKFICIRLLNNSGRPRRLSVTGYAEWVLGDLKGRTQMHIVTETDIRSGAILAKNAYSAEFNNRVAFFDADDVKRTITGDRTEFIGRNGTISNPDAMYRTRLSGRTGAGLDPCAAIQVPVDIGEEDVKQVVFRLGVAKNTQEVLSVIKEFEGTAAAENALQKVKDYWQQTLSAVQVTTPDAAVNILTNGWLNYQTLASRIWGRSGFYQSGGAFGFRDQLQDVLSLIHTRPAITREQILLCASRQFKEGDVQHWWHPPSGRGVRTTCSDDFLWLPFVTEKYITATGDKGLLDETVTFLEGRLLNAGEESYYDLPVIGEQQATLYEHCNRAIEHGLAFGAHGLPLIGSGDWNDGMDKVGHHGKGESVWLGFFLYDILIKFIAIATFKNDKELAAKWQTAALQLQDNIHRHAWDGQWFIRAFFDNGSPLGASQNAECKIDSLAQSWSVLSGAADPERAKMAMNAAGNYLVKRDDGIIKLFDPPFDTSAMNPGYIKGYVPGVRENGGQYTHAAIWLIMAFAAMGNRESTWELLQLVNPLIRAKDADAMEKYATEPYIMAADVYAEPLHKGRGGWTWYTGAAGWMYQLLTESFAGLKRRGDRLYIQPCLPSHWENIHIQYRFISTIYNIEVKWGATATDTKIIVNGQEESNDFVTLIDDGFVHEVVITTGYKDKQPFEKNNLPAALKV
ncbi:GH36-type glycosyl hydrolase domain-containing protein [Ferruginibacter profundus]